MRRDHVRRFFEADVKCYHCGTIVGTLRREDGDSGTMPVFQDRAASAESTVRNLAQLRCNRCRGPVFADELDVVYQYELDELVLERPRRGRPPKQPGQSQKLKSA